MRLGARNGERAVLCLAILLVCTNTLFVPDIDRADGSPIAQALWAILDLIAFIGVMAERSMAMKLAKRSLPIVIVVALAIISAIWSEDPLRTAEKAIGLAGSGILSLYCACRLSNSKFISTLGASLIVAATLSIALVALAPSIGIMPDDSGAWKGCFSHKNLLGQTMVLALIAIGVASRGKAGLALLSWRFGFMLCAIALIGSRSGTSIAVAAGIAIMIPLLRMTRKKRSVKPIVFFVAIVASIALIAGQFGIGLDDALGLFGKDSTLTGRTDLWQFLIEAIYQKPLLGYGYQAFFNPSTSTGNDVIQAAWDAGMAHNGFLQVTLDLGLIGLCLVLRSIWVGLKTSMKLYWFGVHESVFLVLTMFFTLAINFTEAGLAAANDLRWIVFVAAYLIASKISINQLTSPHDISEI